MIFIGEWHYPPTYFRDRFPIYVIFSFEGIPTFKYVPILKDKDVRIMELHTQKFWLIAFASSNGLYSTSILQPLILDRKSDCIASYFASLHYLFLDHVACSAFFCALCNYKPGPTADRWCGISRCRWGRETGVILPSYHRTGQQKI